MLFPGISPFLVLEGLSHTRHLIMSVEGMHKTFQPSGHETLAVTVVVVFHEADRI